MSGFAIEAKFGVDAAGVKDGVGAAEEHVKRGSRRIEEEGARAGRGYGAAFQRTTFNQRKIKSAVVDATGAILQGADATTVLTSATMGLSKSVRGALGLMVLSGILGYVATKTAEAYNKNDDLTESLKKLSTTGFSATNATGAQLIKTLGDIQAKADDARKPVGLLMGTLEAFNPGLEEGRKEAAGKADREKQRVFGEAVSKMKKENEATKAELSGQKERADMMRSNAKHDEAMGAMNRELREKNVSPEMRKGILEQMRQAKVLDQKKIADQYAKQREDEAKREAEKTAKEAEAEVERAARSHDRLSDLQEKASDSKSTLKQINQRLQAKANAARAAQKMYNDRELFGDANDAGIKAEEAEQELRQHRLGRALMSPAQRAAADRAERHASRLGRQIDRRQALQGQAQGKNAPHDFNEMFRKGRTMDDVLKAIQTTNSLLQNAPLLRMQ